MASVMSRIGKASTNNGATSAAKTVPFVRTEEGQQTDLEPQEIGPAIPQVNPRRREVKPQERQQSARHSRSQQFEAAALMPDVRQQRHEHQANPPRQPVHAVYQVDQVGHPDQPRHGDQNPPAVQPDDSCR